MASKEGVIADFQAKLHAAEGKYDQMESALMAQLNRTLALLEATKVALADHHTCDARCKRCGLPKPSYAY